MFKVIPATIKERMFFMMNFITTAITNALTFISERISALGVTAKFIYLAVLALFLLNLASDYCDNSFYRNVKTVIIDWKRDLKLIAGYILANIAMLGITTFILCRIAFSFCYGLPIIVPVAIIVVIITNSAVLIALDMSKFVYTFRSRYMSVTA